MSAETRSGRPAEAGRLPRDFLVGVALLAFCAVTYWVSLGIAEAPAALAQNVQPATFPRLILAIIAVLTVLMMALGFGQTEPVLRTPKLVVLMTGALMIAFVIAFGALGSLAAMIVFCLVMPIVWGEKLSPKLIAYALAFPLAVYLIFDVGLGVYFPPGVIENLIDSAI